MKKPDRNRIPLAAIVSLMLLFTIGCRKDETAIPVLTTSSVIEITDITATSGGKIESDGGSHILEKGVCWSTAQNPTVSDSKTSNGTGNGSFTGNLTGLTPTTPYYVRAYATNSAGTGYGNMLPFTTLKETGETVTDIDGNKYHTVKIGTQIWMSENLKVTKYRNGDPIPEITDLSSWSTLTTGAFSNLLNDINNSAIYGRLYNWFAVNDSRNIAPAGWHVPTDEDWTTLITYLGGESVAGGRMKEKGSTHWCNPNVGATNESGFTALPGGIRSYLYNFIPGCQWGFWWSATVCNDSTAYNRIIFDNEAIINRVNNHIKSGFSVRCIKD